MGAAEAELSPSDLEKLIAKNKIGNDSNNKLKSCRSVLMKRDKTWSFVGCGLLTLALILSLPAFALALDHDKQSHVVAGAAIGYFGTMSGGSKTGALLGCGAGAAKELYDSTSNGTVEFADFAASCGMGFLMSVGVDWLFFDVIETEPILGFRFSF